MNEVQKQLEKMACFMEDTPDPRPFHGKSWWCGDLPFAQSPQDYYPAYVEDDGDKPIAVVWYEYLEDLATTARKLDNAAMKAHLEAAKDLPIGDLLAVSEEHANDYWRPILERTTLKHLT